MDNKTTKHQAVKSGGSSANHLPKKYGYSYDSFKNLLIICCLRLARRHALGKTMSRERMPNAIRNMQKAIVEFKREAKKSSSKFDSYLYLRTTKFLNVEFRNFESDFNKNAQSILKITDPIRAKGNPNIAPEIAALFYFAFYIAKFKREDLDKIGILIKPKGQIHKLIMNKHGIGIFEELHLPIPNSASEHAWEKSLKAKGKNGKQSSVLKYSKMAVFQAKVPNLKHAKSPSSITDDELHQTLKDRQTLMYICGLISLDEMIEPIP